MIRKIINRLFGRADRGTDAVNAYVGGSASDDEVKLVEQMMRDDPALEKDLATQKALLEVFGRFGAVEAPRSFAITPEMVAAADASESRISKLADLFAPQRKLALAPVVLAGFAALTVTLLTIGDITGVVEQSGRRESISTADVGTAESAAAAPAVGETTPSLSAAEDLVAGAPESPVAVEKAIEADSDGQSEPQALQRAATAAPAATLAAPAAAGAAAAEIAPAAMEALESSAPGDDADTVAPPSPQAAAPVPEEADVAPDSSVDDEATERELFDLADAASAGAAEGVDADAADGAVASPLEGAGAGDGVALPLWQLQVALAALAFAVILAWAGLRRVRRD